MKCNAFWPKFNVVLCRRSALIMYTKGFCSLLGLIIFRHVTVKTVTLDYRINVPAGINMPGGTFGKINKRASWKITF